jgi:hypothetical protein
VSEGFEAEERIEQQQLWLNVDQSVPILGRKNENFFFFVCFVYFRMFRRSSSALAKSPPRLNAGYR